MSASLSPVLRSYGLARRYLPPPGLLMRPQLNSDTLSGRGNHPMSDRPSRTWRHFALIFFVATPFLVAFRMLWRGLPQGPTAWLDNFEHALLFTVPLVAGQAIVVRLRSRGQTGDSRAGLTRRRVSGEQIRREQQESRIRSQTSVRWATQPLVSGAHILASISSMIRVLFRS